MLDSGSAPSRHTPRQNIRNTSAMQSGAFTADIRALNSGLKFQLSEPTPQVPTAKKHRLSTPHIPLDI
eukprot:558458-Rhodomonas_salina.2